MTFVVPFDGSDLSGAALVRAVEFGSVLDEPVVAVTAVPNRNKRYARERGWLGPEESFDHDAVVERLQGLVESIAPEVDYRDLVVERYAPSGSIASSLRREAEALGASMVFVGSENAGRLVSTLTSVGSNVAADQDYDVVIVRHCVNGRLDAIRGETAFDDPDSEYYLPRRG